MQSKPRVDLKIGDASTTAIVAGGGRLPIDLARALKQKKIPAYIVLLDGEVEDATSFAGLPQTTMSLEAAGSLLAHLKSKNIKRIVFAGTVKRRPQLSKLRPILPLLPVLPRLAVALRKGDDALLRSLIGYVEKHGIQVVGAHEILPDLLITEGVHTKKCPSSDDKRDIDAALEAALAIGALDIGQAAVAIGGRAIALEGIEGTDGLLQRVADMRDHGRLAGKSGGVLVKSVKPGQEWRTDLPGIGVQTVEGAAGAGLRGIAVVANSTLAMGFKDLIERADTLGLFVVGLSPKERV